jgi:hypothetical protein
MAIPTREVVQLPDVGVAAKATFLERWGVVFLACAGGWIMLIGTAVLTFYFWGQPALPNLSGLSADQVREALAAHKELHDQWQNSITTVFDLLVTKTVLPIVTLLLGYLFGRRSSV